MIFFHDSHIIQESPQSSTFSAQLSYFTLSHVPKFYQSPHTQHALPSICAQNDAIINTNHNNSELHTIIRSDLSTNV